MVSKKKLVLWFGAAGILPLVFFISQEIYAGVITEFGLSFWWQVISSLFWSSLTTMFVSACVMYFPVAILENALPWGQSAIWKRLVLEFIFTSVVAIAAILLWFNLLLFLGVYDVKYLTEPYWDEIVESIVVSFIMNTILVSIYEGVQLFARWKESLILNEKLEKENVVSKFEALKNQINPHFLFNSLNTLSNLVHEDAHKAEDFIDEFSDIYRYILEKKDQPLVTLEEELDFVRAYLKLLQIRFDNGLHSKIHVEAEDLACHIPTLALQTLVENAIKHNRLSKNEPLTINIQSCNQELTVENNYQPRESIKKNGSLGIGLENLKERYSMLSDKIPEFFLDDDSYKAKLPLIRPV